MGPGLAAHVVRGGEVRGAKVHDVDVVPHAGAIAGVVVVAEHGEARALAQGGLQHVGDNVRLGVVGLAYPAARVGSSSVEVAKGD